MKTLKLFITALMLCAICFSCKKSESESVAAEDKSTLHYIVKDNFGLTFLATALYRTGLEKELSAAGPFTLLAPSDAAYQDAGFANPAAVFKSPVAAMDPQMRYHILNNELTLTDMPLQMNLPKATSLGSEIYLSRVIKGQDTITTVNGARVIRLDTRASNGVMQVIDRLLLPNIFENVKDALAGHVELSLFYYALKRSAVVNELLASESYTIYAINNVAMENAGYGTIEAIEDADPKVLQTMLRYHIAKDRKFAQDYFLLAALEETSYAETMLDKRELTVDLMSEWNVPNSFTGIRVKGAGNRWAITPSRTDIMAGNGVIHIIEDVLK